METEILGRDVILGITSLPYEDVPVPEWKKNGVVRIQALTGAERQQYEAEFYTTDPRDKNKRTFGFPENAYALLVVYAAINAHGQKLFTKADMPALATKSAAALSRLGDAAQRLSGLSKADVEALVKDFEPGQTSSSSSGSPAKSE